MLKTENTKINEVQKKALKKSTIEAQKNKMQYHSISEVHASALLNNQKPVFGIIENKIVPITNINESQTYFID